MKTKTSKLFYTIAAVLFLLVCSNANAQTATPGKFRLGLGADALVPLGNTANTQNFGIGLTPRLQYGLSDKLALTFTSGVYHFFPKTFSYPASGSFPGIQTKYQSNIIPVKLGIKAFLGNHFYLSGEAGLAFEVSGGGNGKHFLWSPGVGYATKRWDIGARYENFSGNNYSDGVIALRVAYGFGL